MLRDTGRLLDRRNVPPITVHLPPFPRAVDLVLGRERVEGVDSLMKSAAKKEIEMCNPQEPWCIRTSEATYGGSPCSGPARIAWSLPAAHPSKSSSAISKIKAAALDPHLTD